MGLNFEDIFDLSNQDEVNQNVINIPTPVGGGAKTNVQSQPFLTKDQAKNLAIGAAEFGALLAPGGATMEAAGQAPDFMNPDPNVKLPGFGAIMSDAFGDFKSGDIVGGLAGTGEGILQALGVAGDTAQIYAPAAGVAAPIIFAGGTALKFPNATKNLLKGIFQATKNIPQNQTTQQVQNLATAQQTTNFVGETNTIQEAINNAPVEMQGELQTTADKMLAANNPPDRILSMIQGRVQALGKTKVSKEAPSLNLIPAGTNYNTKYNHVPKDQYEYINLGNGNFFDEEVVVRPTHYNAELVAEKILKDNPNGVKGSDLYNQIVNSNIKNNKITDKEMNFANLSFLKDSDDIFEFVETANGRYVVNKNTLKPINLNDNPFKLEMRSIFESDINKKLGKINNIQELRLSSNDKKLISEARKEVFRDAEVTGRLGPVSGISSVLNSQNIGDKLLNKLETGSGILFNKAQRIEGSAGKGKGDEILDYGVITINNAGNRARTSYKDTFNLRGIGQSQIAHARVSIRLLDGKKYLVIEELQSNVGSKILGTKSKPGEGIQDLDILKQLEEKVLDLSRENTENMNLLKPANNNLVKDSSVNRGTYVFRDNEARAEFFGPELNQILELRDKVIDNQFDIFVPKNKDESFQFSMYPGTQLREVTDTETAKLMENFNNEFQFPGVTDNMVDKLIQDNMQIFAYLNKDMDDIISLNKPLINNTLGKDQNAFKSDFLHLINEIRKSDEISGANSLENYKALVQVFPELSDSKIIFHDFGDRAVSLDKNYINIDQSLRNGADPIKLQLTQKLLQKTKRTLEQLDARNNINTILQIIKSTDIPLSEDVITNPLFSKIRKNFKILNENEQLAYKEKNKVSDQPILKPEQWGKLIFKDLFDLAAQKKLDGVVLPNTNSFGIAGGRDEGVLRGYDNLQEVFKNTAKEIGKDADSIQFESKIGNNMPHTVIEVDTITEPKSKSVYKQGGLVGSLNGINVLDLGEARNG